MTKLNIKIIKDINVFILRPIIQLSFKTLGIIDKNNPKIIEKVGV